MTGIKNIQRAKKTLNIYRLDLMIAHTRHSLILQYRRVAAVTCHILSSQKATVNQLSCALLKSKPKSAPYSLRKLGGVKIANIS